MELIYGVIGFLLGIYAVISYRYVNREITLHFQKNHAYHKRFDEIYDDNDECWCGKRYKDCEHKTRDMEGS
jgi:hypothetical protein